MANEKILPSVIAKNVVEKVGGKENISSMFYCMTRLRMTVVDESKVSKEGLKLIEGVMGVVESNGQLQIILGPGRVIKVANEVKALTGIDVGELDEAKVKHDEIKEKNATPFKLLLRKISSIFIPLIPAFIACGLVTGLYNIIIKMDPAFAKTATGGILFCNWWFCVLWT